MVDATSKGAHNVFGMKNSQQIPRVAAILWHLSTISIQAKVLSIGARDRLTAQKSSIFSPK
ncbi:hypothetical protein, partial [Sulfitobacter sp.]|uniref:hypothetical protein n=1 Tax=Sulfitobacter sp. TaxID=1903071 RepID=UPI003561EBCC